jgi:hypothetical protein
LPKNTIRARAGQLANASYSMVDTLMGIVIEARLEQPLNVRRPIIVVFFPIFIETRFVQP